ncbi:MAG: glutamate--tRNA ligase [Candidatus Delongbacteria bacterium]|jgi:glutamyl-tRNA synthetase|nr:glutamate--tRNA ligase [Candidatus Delongbacteria bacterium]
MSEFRTRFAPSPTGYMHIGNLRTALYAYLIAKGNAGKFLLRVEDTDQKRTIAEAFKVIFDSLEIAGIEYDEGPDKDGGYGPYIQSERKKIYEEHLSILLEKDLAYRCFCTAEEMEEQRKDFADTKGIVFRDKCRNLSKDEVNSKIESNLPFVVRQRIPESGQTTINDIVFGSITIENNTLDEQVLMKSDGFPTYNFANVVDDHLMKISHVIRGYEYLSSVPKYNLLYENFGWDVPQYIHLPHIMREDGKKMSKRHGDASFEDLIDAGYLTDAIINYIVMLGWNPGTDEEIFTMEELIEKFTPERINKSNAVFSIDKLNWINAQHIKKLSQEEFHSKADKYYSDELRAKVDVNKVSGIIQNRLEKFTDIPEMVKFFITVENYTADAFFHKKMKSNTESSYEYLQKILPIFQNLTEWNNESIFGAMLELIEKEECKKGKVLWPVRIAFTGLKASPGGASEVGELIGKEESLKRIENAIEFLKGEI